MENKKEILFEEVKEHIFSLYEIVDILYNFDSCDDAEYFGEEIRNLEELIKKLEKECK